MLSVDKISDPSCSSKISEVGTDEKAPQELDCQEGDPLVADQATAPNFSIRNHVFESRSKNIETNWPFAHPFLTLCLKNGIKDILPPFEAPNLVRARCLQKLGLPDQPVASLVSPETSEHADFLEPEHASPFHVNEAVIGQRLYSPEQFVDSTNKAACPSSNNWKSKGDQAVNLDELVHTSDEPIISSTLTTNEQGEQTSAPVSGISCTVVVDKSALEQPAEGEVVELCDKLEKLKRPSEKKGRLTVKLSAISEANLMEDLTLNASAVSDPMASKVCPVCKTFSSSSNTTLNAHIDQCLSVESNDKIMDNLQKLKVKPRKKRLMVDIYTDALRCTLEDLDRRNGTNWAVELALSVAPAGEAVSEAKRQKMTLTEPRTEAADDAVYVDSNGIKLRILSKFNDIPLVREDSKVKKNVQEKNVTEKKKDFAPKFSKKMKMKSQKKMSNSLKILKYQMQQADQREHATENEQMVDEYLPYEQDARITFEEGEKSTLKQWKSSKHGKTVGKFSARDTCDNMGGKKHAKRNSRLECLKNRHSDEFNSSFLRRPSNKVLKLTEAWTSPPKTKSVELLCRAFNTRCGENRSPEPPSSDSEQSSESSSSDDSFLPDLSRQSKPFMSLSNKGLGLNTRSNEISKSSSQLTSSPPKTRATKQLGNSPLMKNQFTDKPFFSLEATNGEASGKPSSSKMFRKHRSNLRTTKRVPVILSPPGLHLSFTSPDLANARNDDAFWHLKSSNSKNASGLEMRNKVLPINRATQELERGESSSLMEVQECDILPSEAKFNATNVAEVEIFDEQVDLIGTGPSSSDEPPFACETINTESPGVVSTSIQDVDTCTGKYMDAFLSSEAHVLKQFKSRSDKKDAIGVDGSGSDNLQCAQLVGETKIYDVEDAFASQLSENQSDAISAQESSGCVTSHEDSEHDEPNKNSSITSARTTMNQEQNLDSDSEPVRSTVSLPSPKDSEAKDSETKLVAGDSSIRDKLDLSAKSSSENGSRVEKESKESDQVLSSTNNGKGNDRIIEEKAFCCSCRESLSRESQFLEQNTNDRTSKVKPVSKLVIRPGNSSSFTKYQNRSVNMTASSSLPSGQPIFVQNTLDSTLNYQYYGDNLCFPSPSTPSTSNATLRLMGKNLVLNHDESSQPQINDSVYQTAASISTAGIPCTNDLQIDHFHRQHQNQLMSRSAFGQVASVTSHQMPLHLPNPALGGFAGPLFTGSFLTIPNQQIQPKMHEKANSYRAPYKPQEIIVIDDSPERVLDRNGCIASSASNLPLFTSGHSPLPHGQSSYFPVQTPAFGVSAPSSNIYPSIYPRVSSIGYMNQGNTSEYQGPILPSHIVFRSSTGPMTSPVFYSETMR